MYSSAEVPAAEAATDGDLDAALSRYGGDRDRIAGSMFDDVDRIAGYGWDLAQLRHHLRDLSSAMSTEAESIAGAGEPRRSPAQRA